MKNNDINSIIENLFFLLPIVHKKLLKIETLNTFGDIQLSRIHLAVMGILSENTLPISEIARRLLISKPQMTHLIHKLIGSGLVEKRPDKSDRRVINISLTDNGRVTLKDYKELLRENIRGKLACLSEKDIDVMSLYLAKLREILSRLE